MHNMTGAATQIILIKSFQKLNSRYAKKLDLHNNLIEIIKKNEFIFLYQ